MFYSYLESVGMWEIMQSWSASESESLKFSICIPVYSPYTSWTTRAHIIPSKLSRRSHRGKSTQDYFPWLLSLSDVFYLVFASATSGSLRQWASYVYLSSGCKVPYLTKHKQNGLGITVAFWIGMFLLLIWKMPWNRKKYRDTFTFSQLVISHFPVAMTV